MNSDFQRISNALQFVDSSDRETWVQMAMAVKAELGNDGFDLWDAWSQQGDSYKASDARDVWRGIKPGGGVNIGTLFHHAKRGGWRDDSDYTPPSAEELAYRQQRAEARAAADAEQIQREKAETASKAKALFKAATEARPDHPYLVQKGVSPTATLREMNASAIADALGYAPKSGGEPLTGRVLVVPVKQGDNISTLELIDQNGRKTALPGRGTKAGGYWAALRLPDDGDGLTLMIGEGVATVLSARAANGHHAIAALSSGNLQAVATIMRERYPTATLLILADLNKTTGEPDSHALDAARATGGKVAIPEFGSDRDTNMTDFNDAAQIFGSEAVARMIADAIEPTAAAAGDDWPDPLPIPSTLLPVEPFSDLMLPDSLRPWIADIAERMQCPPDFPAVGAMVALSSVIGRKACIQPKRVDTDWKVMPNLWGAVVGRPGVMKSPALSEVMKPLTRMETAAQNSFETAMRAYDEGAAVDELMQKAAKDNASRAAKKGNREEAARLLFDASPPDLDDMKPALRRYKVTDATVEALGEILIENPWGVLAYRDELHGLLCSLDREGQEGARAFYLQGYDGDQGYTFDRIMRGRYLHIPAVCIAMLGGIQPGKLQGYIRDAVSGGSGDDGLLQRFGLLVWPDIDTEWRNVDRFPDSPAKAAAFETFSVLDAMQPGTDPETGEQIAICYRFSDDAQERFEAWRNDFERERRSEDFHPAMQSHLSKYRKLVPALALVIALADRETEVSDRSLLKALAWADYLQSHAARTYAAGTGPSTEAAAALLAKIRNGSVQDGFKPADVYLKGWSHLATREAVNDAATLLCDLQCIRRNETKPGNAGGRPSVTYTVNPKILRG